MSNEQLADMVMDLNALQLDAEERYKACDQAYKEQEELNKQDVKTILWTVKELFVFHTTNCKLTDTWSTVRVGKMLEDRGMIERPKELEEGKK